MRRGAPEIWDAIRGPHVETRQHGTQHCDLEAARRLPARHAVPCDCALPVPTARDFERRWTSTQLGTGTGWLVTRRMVRGRGGNPDVESPVRHFAGREACDTTSTKRGCDYQGRPGPCRDAGRLHGGGYETSGVERRRQDCGLNNWLGDAGTPPSAAIVSPRAAVCAKHG